MRGTTSTPIARFSSPVLPTERLDRAGSVSIEPFLGVATQRVHVDGTVEQGGDAALAVDSATLNSTMTELGVRVGGAAKAGPGQL